MHFQKKKTKTTNLQFISFPLGSSNHGLIQRKNNEEPNVGLFPGQLITGEKKKNLLSIGGPCISNYR